MIRLIGSKRYAQLLAAHERNQILMDYLGDGPLIAAEMLRRDKENLLAQNALQRCAKKLNEPPTWYTKK